MSRRFRYALSRDLYPGELPLGKSGTVLFVMLNPSTADDTEDDPTIRKCMGFARKWGYGGLSVRNLYSYRATKPTDLIGASNPIGHLNDEWIVSAAASASRIVAAWGTFAYERMPGGRDRADHIKQLLESVQPVHCIGKTKHGFPCHPLYLSYKDKLEVWV